MGSDRYFTQLNLGVWRLGHEDTRARPHHSSCRDLLTYWSFVGIFDESYSDSAQAALNTRQYAVSVVIRKLH